MAVRLPPMPSLVLVEEFRALLQDDYVEIVDSKTIRGWLLR
jgi:hypothetical protein